ncbi:adenylate cyclase type 2-like [Galleria mellonella]|uniref:adenylate cyclase n=1 Tax=Galleria mellonella TaxID=7137 RepID=A0A6J1WZM1_GALME|nr:adenylate cyclase type 2-like [Galleria mellonella]
MDEHDLSRTTGFVPHQVAGLELLTRYSMNTARATSILSSLADFRNKENEQTGGKQWNWQYLRDQFFQKELEGLYRKYDDKLRESLIYIYITLLLTFSTVHIVLVVVYTYSEEVQSQSTYLSMGMYVLRITLPILCLWKCFYDPNRKKWFWMPIVVSFIIIVDLVVTDVTVPIHSVSEGIALRPAYSTTVLLSIYVFLPLRNNYLVIILGVLVSTVYVLIYAFFTYYKNPQIGVVIASDIIYMVGVNIMGTYFRLMNEIVTRRSFLDRQACVESTWRLKFVKSQEERLMLSILPEHIVSKVRQDIRSIYLSLQSHDLVHNIKSFNDRYVEEHDNVSILYADVVNYTRISTTLSPMRMVELLNELFGRFDEASEELDVLRIKFLGDCYYCVSGIPKPNAQHAKNCVDLGLEMIHIIKDVREKRSLNIDMRIGVHSGRILSGLIGIRKWQYDIWSKDATIANKMESTGQAGKVHVTKQTLELLQGSAREYVIEPNSACQNDVFITKNKLETYLLSRPSMPVDYKPFHRASVGLNRIISKTTSRLSERRNLNHRRTTSFIDDNLVEYQLMLKAADAQMAKEIEDMTSGRNQIMSESRLNKITLMFKNFDMEKSFLLQADPLFKYYITCCLFILLLTFLINGLTTDWFNGFHWYTWTLFGALILILLAMQPLTWFHIIWLKHNGIEEPKNPYLRSIYDLSINIIRSAKIRTAIYMIISTGLAAMSIVNVIGCTEVEVEPSTKTVLSNCVSPWHVTQCWGLALLLNFLFSRVFFIFKWIVAGGMTTFYLWMVWGMKTDLFAADVTWNVGLDPRVSHTLTVVSITLTLYWIDRMTEFRNRLDYLWQVQLGEEQQEAETMLKVNNMLLENILPGHVVQVYLNMNRSIDELYYEKYDNVAVMFASLTDYKLGVEDDADLSDKTVLGMLDSVISDFDRLLLTGSSAYKVEKIKMAGWTYMAACGLDPSKRQSFDSTSINSNIKNQNTIYNRAIIMTMLEFAAAMMRKLQDFNRGSFQSFEGLNLRIGISNGEVAAGVVGSSKPLYDIWGHAVNMASRMDSTGETGKIQVTENTALILEDCGILTTYRGETLVKGAGYIKTYYVPLDEHLNPVRIEKSNDYYKRIEKKNQYEIRDSIYSYTSSECEVSDTQSQNITHNIEVTSDTVDSNDGTESEGNMEISGHNVDDSKGISPRNSNNISSTDIIGKVIEMDKHVDSNRNDNFNTKANIVDNNNHDIRTFAVIEVPSHTQDPILVPNNAFISDQIESSCKIEVTDL